MKGKMKCPYCAEEIADEARACHYCGRDFMFLNPLQEKLSALEQRFSDIEKPNSNPPLPPINPRLVRFDLVLLAFSLALVVPIACRSTLSAVTYFHLDQQWWSSGSGALLITNLSQLAGIGILGAPLLFGCLPGRMWPGRHLLGYIVLGVLLGLIAFPVQVLVDWWLQYVANENVTIDYYKQNIGWSYALFGFSITPALLFLSGEFFGDLWESRKHPSKIRESRGPVRLTTGLLSRFTGEEPSERLTKFLALAGPSIVAICGLLSAALPLLFFLATGKALPK